jgi:hypothetical protein
MGGYPAANPVRFELTIIAIGIREDRVSGGTVEVGGRSKCAPIPVLDDFIEYGGATPLAAQANGESPTFLLGRDVHDVNRPAIRNDACPCRLSKAGVSRTSQRGNASKADFHVDHLCLRLANDGQPSEHRTPTTLTEKVRK